jgi:putative flippase GtrA
MSRLLRIARSHGITGQFVRYGVVAASGYVLAIVLYTLEVDAGIAPYLALGIAFVLNGLYNFALMRRFVFPPSGRRVHVDLSRFCVVATASFVVNYASFAVLYSAIGLHAETSQRIAILIAAPVTFFANRLWGFRTRGERRGDHDAVEPAAATSAKNTSYSRM